MNEKGEQSLKYAVVLLVQEYCQKLKKMAAEKNIDLGKIKLVPENERD